MHSKKIRAQIAAWLDRRSSKTTGTALKTRLYKASRAVYPVAKLKRKVPEDEVFISARQLSSEAQDAIKRVQANLKKLNLPKNSLLYNAPIFVVSAISSLATNT